VSNNRKLSFYRRRYQLQESKKLSIKSNKGEQLKIAWEPIIISDRLPVRFAIAPLEELRKLIDAINRSVVPPVSSAANINPWFANNESIPLIVK
jgi:hypothetical protein